MSVRLGELLTKASLITQDQLKDALKMQKETGGKLGETLIKLGFVSEEDITECLSQQFGVPSINLAHFEIDAGVIKLALVRSSPRRTLIAYFVGSPDVGTATDEFTRRANEIQTGFILSPVRFRSRPPARPSAWR